MTTPDTILVTGAAGFIGSHVVEAILEDGRRVVGYDNLDDFYEPAIKRANLRAALDHPRFTFHEGDIRDDKRLDDLFASQPFGAVIHLAARAGVRPSIDNPVLYASVNLEGTTRVLETCRRHSVRRFLFGSSSSVYGNNRKTPFAEDDPVDHPISPYAATKKGGELLCHTYHHLFEMDIACLRFFTVYGPRQRPEMAIHRFTRQLAEGRPIQQFGDGDSARDYTFVSDIVRGVRLALERCAGYTVWNLGGSQTTTLQELVRKIAAGLGVEPRIERLPAQPGDVQQTWADIGKAERDLGWRPECDIDRGLELFLNWYGGRRG